MELYETCKELLFIREVLTFMGIKISLPIVIHVENMGDLFMETTGHGKHSKHVDIHNHFIQQYIEDGVIKIIFIPKSKNKSDGVMKNN